MRRRTLWILVASVLAGLVLVAHTLWNESGWPRRARAEQALETLEQKNDAMRERIDALGREVRALRERPEVQERAVRQELGYVKPGEVVLETPPPKN